MTEKEDIKSFPVPRLPSPQEISFETYTRCFSYTDLQMRQSIIPLILMSLTLNDMLWDLGILEMELGHVFNDFQSKHFKDKNKNYQLNCDNFIKSSQELCQTAKTFDPKIQQFTD